MRGGGDDTGRGETSECSCRRRTRPWGAVSFALAVLAAACAQEEAGEAPKLAAVLDHPYTVRLDSESSDLDLFEIADEGEALRVRTGPAGIAYRPEDSVRSGTFRLEATFVQLGAPLGYREAYGIFVGGLDLSGPDQEYTYLLVRPTGDYLIKRRLGEVTETLVDWTPHTAVRRVVEEGDEPQNTLGIDVALNEVVFIVNGVAVHTLPIGRARPYGIAGLRVNHRLDVRVVDWFLGRDPRDS